MKYVFIVLSLLLGGVALVFVCDSIGRRSDSDPSEVSKNFCYTYMFKDSKYMKRCSDKSLHRRIDSLNYPQVFSPQENVDQYSLPADSYDLFRLVVLERLGKTIVATYRYREWWDDNSPILFYSCVLNPIGSPIYWDRFKDFIYSKVPLGSKLFEGPPVPKDRWLVTDFFSEDDIQNFLTHNIDNDISDVGNMTDEQFSAWSDSLDKQIAREIKWEKSFEKKWSQECMKEQNARLKSLYLEYSRPESDTVLIESRR